jgi:hypothetical protein
MGYRDHDLRKYGPLTILFLVAAGTGLVGYLQADPASNHDRIYLRNGGGPVLFTHAGHAARADDCVTCHHDLVGAVATDCSECHDDGYEAGLLEHAELLEIDDHTCAGCHELGDPDSIRSCRQCHPAAAIDAVVPSCGDCHDDPDYTPELASHADLLTIEDHTCDGCHVAVPVSDAYHTQCNACHLTLAPARFAAADGRARCVACHLK